MTSKEKLKIRKSGLRVIDQDRARYNIVGNLKRLAREIERGEHGRVRDCVVALRTITSHPPDITSQRTIVHQFGMEGLESAAYTLKCAQEQI